MGIIYLHLLVKQYQHGSSLIEKKLKRSQ